MMLTPIAEQLIDNLRNDEHTRKYFSIARWHGKGQCGSVGCIAGTAIAMAYEFHPDIGWEAQFKLRRQPFDPAEPNHAKVAAPMLGLDLVTARQVFTPWSRWFYPLQFGWGPFEHLGENERPSEDYVAEMREWAENINPRRYRAYTPDRCALALERVTRDEIPYVDWKYAFEECVTT